MAILHSARYPASLNATDAPRKAARGFTTAARTPQKTTTMLSSRLAARSAAAARQARARRTLSTPAAAAVASDALPSYVSEAPVAEVSTLENGVRVASVYGAGSNGPSYATARIASVGSRFDHVGGESALLAASLGGVTGREHIALTSLTSLTAPGDIADLKAALTAKVANNSYEAQMMDHLHATAYQTMGKGNSLGNFLEGTEESIAAVTPTDVAKVASNVKGSDVVVVGTGSGSHDRLVEAANKAYGDLPAGAGITSSKAVAAATGQSAFIGSDVRIRYDSQSNATVALGFEGASWTDPNALPLALMTTLLGSFQQSSGLGKNVAQSMCQEVADHGLASSIGAFSLSYSDAGLFGITATAPDNKLDDLLWYVMPNLVRLAHGVSDEEFARAKIALKAQLLGAMDGDVALGETVAEQLQTIGRVMSLSETVARVDALEMSDVKAAADRVINDQDHALAAIGGIHELPDYNWIRRHSYMLRY